MNKKNLQQTAKILTAAAAPVLHSAAYAHAHANIRNFALHRRRLANRLLLKAHSYCGIVLKSRSYADMVLQSRSYAGTDPLAMEKFVELLKSK